MRIVRLLKFFLFVALLLLISSSDSYARDIYVAPSGSTCQPATPTSPISSIQAAIDQAIAGDTIHVCAGTYLGQLRFSRSGAAGAPITLRNYQGQNVIIDLQGNYNTPTKQILLQSTAGETTPMEWITIEGLEIRNGYNGIKIYNGLNVIIRNNRIYYSARQGVLGNGYKVVFERNIVAHSAHSGSGAPQTSNQYHGIYFTGNDIIVRNNIFYSNLGYGLQIAGYPLGMIQQAGPEYSDAKNWLVSNNVFAYQRLRGGLTLYFSGATNNKIRNNIFYDNSQEYISGETGINFTEAGAGNELDNNLYFSPRGRPPIIKDGKSAPHTENNALIADPKLNGVFDFSLKVDSPAINRGLNDLRVIDDFIGTSRPKGISQDIGAFEYTASPNAPKTLRIE
jgi:Right handed beta helix region